MGNVEHNPSLRSFNQYSSSSLHDTLPIGNISRFDIGPDNNHNALPHVTDPYENAVHVIVLFYFRCIIILLSDDDGDEDEDEDDIDDVDGKWFSLDRNALVDVQFFSSTLDGISTLLHHLV